MWEVGWNGDDLWPPCVKLVAQQKPRRGGRVRAHPTEIPPHGVKTAVPTQRHQSRHRSANYGATRAAPVSARRLLHPFPTRSLSRANSCRSAAIDAFFSSLPWSVLQCSGVSVASGLRCKCRFHTHAPVSDMTLPRWQLALLYLNAVLPRAARMTARRKRYAAGGEGGSRGAAPCASTPYQWKKQAFRLTNLSAKNPPRRRREESSFRWTSRKVRQADNKQR